MKDELYLATSVFKYYAGSNDLVFKVIQPLFGTYDKEKEVFTNFNKKKYFEIIDKRITFSEKRIGFYNLTRLSVLEKEFNTTNIEEIVTRYFEKYKKLGYHFDGISIRSFDYTYLKDVLDHNNY